MAGRKQKGVTWKILAAAFRPSVRPQARTGIKKKKAHENLQLAASCVPLIVPPVGEPLCRIHSVSIILQHTNRVGFHVQFAFSFGLTMVLKRSSQTELDCGHLKPGDRRLPFNFSVQKIDQRMKKYSDWRKFYRLRPHSEGCGFKDWGWSYLTFIVEYINEFIWIFRQFDTPVHI